jgi:hypothetical protein
LGRRYATLLCRRVAEKGPSGGICAERNPADFRAAKRRPELFAAELFAGTHEVRRCRRIQGRESRRARAPRKPIRKDTDQATVAE